MRTLYQKCKLVHGDLSEYNILYFEVRLTVLQNYWLAIAINWLNIHGPFSCFISILQGHLYIIDVSQSVDLDHPSALEFLKEDCLHVSVTWCAFATHFLFCPSNMSDILLLIWLQDFFRKHGIAVMTVKELFDFVVDASITDEDVDDYLEKVLDCHWWLTYLWH